MKAITINYNESDAGLMAKLPRVLKHIPSRLASLEGCSSVDIGIDHASFTRNPDLQFISLINLEDNHA